MMLILCSDASDIENYNAFSLLLLYLQKSSPTFSCMFIGRRWGWSVLSWHRNGLDQLMQAFVF